MGPAADLVEELAQALLDEEQARADMRAAIDRQADLLRQLRKEGLTLPVVASRVLRRRGLVLPIADRLKVAERLRKRAARRTVCPPDRVMSHGLEPVPASPCERAIMPETMEIDMARIVKKITTVTEEYLEPNEQDQEEDEIDEADDKAAEDDDEPEASEQPRHGRRR